jgi:hypothetical protein
MAKFRQTHVHIWKDSWFRQLRTDHRLLFIYLFSNDRAHTSGVYEIPFDVLLFESGLEEEEARQALAYFEESGRAYYDEASGHLFVRNLMRYNGANVLTNSKVRANLRAYRQAEGASLRYWDLWQDAYPRVAEEVFGSSQKEKKEEQEQKNKQAPPDGAASGASAASSAGDSRPEAPGSERPSPASLTGTGVDGALRLLEQARGEPPNSLDRRRLEEMVATAEAHRLSLRPGQSGAARSGLDWVLQAIEEANASRKPGTALSLKFVDSILQRWLAEGFQAPWGGTQEAVFYDIEYWGD